MNRVWRKWMIGSACAASVIMMSACGGGEEKADDGQVELTIWLWKSMGIESLIEQYAEEHDIKVNIQIADFNDVHTNLTTALAAGSGAPDISAIEVKGIDKMKANPDHFHNLFDYGGAEAEGDYLDWKWQQALSIDGEYLLGLPTDIGPQALAYRVDLFEEAGLPTDREEVAEQLKTWDDFIAAGELVKEKTGKAILPNPGNMYAVMEGQGDSKYFDAEGNIIVEDNPAIHRAYDYAMEVIGKGLTTNMEDGSTEWSAGLVNGDFATVVAPAWRMTQIQESAPDAAGLWDITQIPEGSGNMGGSFLTVPKESKHPQEAYDLIEWVLAPEQQLTVFRELGNFPSTPSVYDSEELVNFTSEYFNDAPVGKIYSEAAERVTPILEGPESIQIEKILGDAVTRVQDGQDTPESSWDAAMKSLEREIGR
ncbi:extracellular solute-binding protein [Alkalicoccobacillus gibsonii]|uniref:Extracellular solute-binding protein n=1 Tax=Alkalicoccobacillus gibsonii TaxID=79881 RepID=A0ABU9VED7_9BACI